MLATIDRGFEILVKVFPDDNVVHLELPSKEIAHGLAMDFVAFSFELMQFPQARPDAYGRSRAGTNRSNSRDIAAFRPQTVE
jgi:hypothetical protein